MGCDYVAPETLIEHRRALRLPAERRLVPWPTG